jgi:hypothetical protein
MTGPSPSITLRTVQGKDAAGGRVHLLDAQPADRARRDEDEGGQDDGPDHQHVAIHPARHLPGNRLRHP